MTKRTSVVVVASLIATFVFLLPVQPTTNSTMLAATAEPTAEAEQKAPLKWPLTPAKQQQVNEATECDLENLPAKRYPEKMTLDELADAFEVKTACDWAVLAVAYKGRVKEEDAPAPKEGIEAFKQAVSMNSALAFRLPVLGAYYGVRGLVEASPLSQQPITRVKVTYAFSGIQSEPVQMNFTIDKANTDKPVVSGKSGVEKPTKVSGTIDKSVVQALGTALTDLIPMEAQFTQQVCYDDYPDWDVSLTFKDGTTIKVTNNESNIYFFGGPVQTTIKRQNYMQYSDAFLEALLNVLDALKLPKGETQGMYCYGIDKDPMTLAFPTMMRKPTATKKP